jgi:hypothetical protein
VKNGYFSKYNYNKYSICKDDNHTIKIPSLHVSEAFLMIRWNPCLEQHRVGAELSEQQRIVAINLGEKANALMPFVEVRRIL